MSKDAQNPDWYRRRKTTAYAPSEYTDAEVDALQKEFGLKHIALDHMRREIDQAAIFYHRHENPQVPNKRGILLESIQKRTNALLQLLEKATENHFHEDLIAVEPPGLRHSLYRMRDLISQQLITLEPQIDHGVRQKRAIRKGLNNYICHLSFILVWFRNRPHDYYTQSPGTYEYSGEFINFVARVGELCRIHLANQTIGDAVKRLRGEDKIPWKPRNR